MEKYLCAKITYLEFIKANSREEAKKIFESNCPPNIDGEVVVIDQETPTTYER